jgi:type IV pilus assembly protein PilB
LPLKKRKSLGESLVEQKLLSEADLKKAQAESEKTGELLRRSLVKLGMVSEEDIIAFYEEQLGIPHVELSNYLIDQKTIKIIPETLARRYHVLPLFKTGDSLTLAMDDPLNVIALDDIKLKTGHSIEPVVASEIDLKEAINQYYGTGGSIDEVINKIDTEEKISIPEKEEDISLEKLHDMAEEAPIIKLVNLIIMQALRDGASDIHIEPEKDDVHVRMRVDGIMHETKPIPKQLQAAVISRTKIMSDLNIAIKRIPQDGRFQINLEGAQIDIRVSSFPTVFGENIVMRLLDTSSILLGLEQIGFSKETFKQFQSLIKKPHGIILVTGPTGSGKTTTLYSALNAINTPDKNIITLEDPVEYQLKGIRQSQVNPKVGMTFASGLRSILRQDPDVVMVGEIRDKETAEIAVQAALTGHLVFSTLHTNDAPSALTRLTDMGIEPFLISSSVIGILAQRLVRTICNTCKTEFNPPAKSLSDLGLEAKTDMKLFHGKGCNVCKNSGYKGRTGLYELMTLNDKIKELVLTKTSSSIIKKAAREAGMKTLQDDGLIKVLDGATTIDEVMRVTMLD